MSNWFLISSGKLSKYFTKRPKFLPNLFNVKASAFKSSKSPDALACCISASEKPVALKYAYVLLNPAPSDNSRIGKPSEPNFTSPPAVFLPASTSIV